MSHEPLPSPRSAPDPFDDDGGALLQGATAALAAALPEAPPPAARAGILRERLLDRVNRSARASRAFVTVRRHGAASDSPAPGVVQTVLYEAGHGPLRRGEPRRVRFVELAPGTRWQPPAVAPGDHAELLLVRGALQADGVGPLGVRDYHRVPAGQALPTLTTPAGAEGALLYLRESPLPAQPGEAPHTARDADSPWHDYGPGIRRRVLWTHNGEAAMLYHALPGAAVPRHAHGHDEECLMLEGDVFLDDMLLRTGDYQLAPAGTQHQGVGTDTGGVLYAHGDLDLDVQPG